MYRLYRKTTMNGITVHVIYTFLFGYTINLCFGPQQLRNNEVVVYFTSPEHSVNTVSTITE